MLLAAGFWQGKMKKRFVVHKLTEFRKELRHMRRLNLLRSACGWRVPDIFHIAAVARTGSILMPYLLPCFNGLMCVAHLFDIPYRRSIDLLVMPFADDVVQWV